MIDLVGQLTRFDIGGGKSFPEIGPRGGCDTNWTRHKDRWESIHVSITPLVRMLQTEPSFTIQTLEIKMN